MHNDVFKVVKSAVMQQVSTLKTKATDRERIKNHIDMRSALKKEISLGTHCVLMRRSG